MFSLMATEIKVKKAKIRNIYNQVPHLTRDTAYGEVTKAQESITHTRAKGSALSQFCAKIFTHLDL